MIRGKLNTTLLTGLWRGRERKGTLWELKAGPSELTPTCTQAQPLSQPCYFFKALFHRCYQHYKHQALASSIIPTEMESAYGCFLVILSLWVLSCWAQQALGALHIFWDISSWTLLCHVNAYPGACKHPLVLGGCSSLPSTRHLFWFQWLFLLFCFFLPQRFAGLLKCPWPSFFKNQPTCHLPHAPLLNSNCCYYTPFCSTPSLATIIHIIKHCPHKSLHSISQFSLRGKCLPSNGFALPSNGSGQVRQHQGVLGQPGVYIFRDPIS